METAAETKPEGDVVGKHPVRDVPVDENAGAVPDNTVQDCNSKAPIEEVFTGLLVAMTLFKSL